MKSAKLGILTLALSLVAPLAGAGDLKVTLLENLAFMKSVYRAEYAPTAWKQRYAGWTLEQSYQKAVEAAEKDPALTVQRAREIVKDFIYSMQDYHVSVLFSSTELATLPLMFKEAEGRIFIAYISRDKLSSDSFPYAVGDELVSIDGVKAADAVTKLQAEISLPNVGLTDRALAVYNLARRRGSRGLTVPSGPVTLEILSKGSETPSRIQLIWDYTPETVPVITGNWGKAISSTKSDEEVPMQKKIQNFFNKSMIAKGFELDSKELAGNPHVIGGKESFIPALGTVLWSAPAESEFKAYMYLNDEGKIVGYVRIPSYVPSSSVKAVSDFAEIVDKFEGVTQGLVIDQVNNPGGSVFYLYALVSMLSNQPMVTPRHEMAIDPREVTEAVGIIKELSEVRNDEDAKKAIGNLGGIPATYQIARFLVQYAQFIVDEAKAGRRLSSPYWIAGVDHINPSSTRYTKPILILVNELDFSGGDFFPTIMQDNKRATIMGTRTAGAGGYVNETQYYNQLGVDLFTCTRSIAHRVDGNPIENLGVTPDIAYSLKASDVQGGYRDYVKAINQALSALIK